MTDEKRMTHNSTDEASTSSKQLVNRSETEPTAATKEVIQQNPTTRSERNGKKEKTEESMHNPHRSKITNEDSAIDQTSEAKPVRWVQIRMLPIYVRVLIVLVIFALAIVVGTYIGYSILGDGAASDIFKKETWTHIIDIMNGTE